MTLRGRFNTMRGMKSHAIVAAGPKTAEFREVESGELGEWDICVELECSAISAGTESYSLSNADPAHPYIIGYGPVGRVIDVGAQVRAASLFSKGDRVTYFAPRAAAGLGQGCGAYVSPAFLDVNPQHRNLLGNNCYCVKVPGSVSSEHAAFAGISAVSYMGAELPNTAPGDKVVVIGQGIIGLYATQHAALRGAQVIAADLLDKRLALARRCGADHAVNTGQEDLVKAVRKIWPEGADIIVDSTGSFRLVEKSMGAARFRGKYVFLAWYKGSDFCLGSMHGIVFQAFLPWTLEGRLVAAAMKLMAMGALQVEPLISHRFAAKAAAEAYRFVYEARDQYTGILLDWRK